MICVDTIQEAFKLIESFSGIIFDLDDTLYPEREYVRSGFHAVAQVLSQTSRAEEKLWKLFEEGTSAIDDLLKQERIYSDELKQICIETYRKHTPCIALYPGVKQGLENLKNSGKQVGLITDGRPEGQREKIRSLQIERLFDTIIVTDELGGSQFRKPNVTAFRKVHEQWKIPYDDMVYVGDNVSKDFIAPKELGMNCVWVRNKEGLYYNESND